LRVRLKARNIREIYEEAAQRPGAMNVHGADGSGSRLEWAGRIGGGRFEWNAVNLELRPGLLVNRTEIEASKPFTVEMEVEEPYPPDTLFLGFWVSGLMRCTLPGTKEPFEVSSGKNILVFNPWTSGAGEYPAGRRNVAVGVTLERKVWMDLLQTDSTPFFGHIPGAASEGRYLPVKTSPQTREVLQQMLDCPFEGVIRRLYLESKVLELVALRLAQPPAQPISNGRRTAGFAALGEEDAERVRQAAGIFETDLAAPPSLLALARQVGLNDYKLKAGFRQVFGTTAFGYLHERRMEEARSLLEEGALNVGEVALAVGFSDHSSFSAAFKKRFGLKPSSLRRRVPASR